ncbi:hypothetical protein [Pseudomonas sp. SMV7]|uniref:hypothetical protein n=1 Tax=Pseudomonas sp. SMV7 TaxID=3390194 RepID=UPI003F84E414
MKYFILALCAGALSGCFQQIVKPSEITLVDAMTQVGQGLTAMRQAQGDVKTGMIAESAEVTFKISADQTNGGKLKLDLSPPAVSDGVGVGGELSGERIAARSNTVTVKFKNVLALPKDSVGFAVAATQIGYTSDAAGAKPPTPAAPGGNGGGAPAAKPGQPVQLLPNDIAKWVQYNQMLPPPPKE